MKSTSLLRPADRPFPFAQRPRRWLADTILGAVAMVAVLHIAIFDAALGCGGGAPPPTMECAKSTVLVKAVPGIAAVAPAGGVIGIPVTVFVASIDGRNAFGIPIPCPMPVNTTVTLTVTCGLPPSPAPAMIVIPTPAPGIYAGVVPVAIPAGPPRLCAVAGTATTAWGDGTMTTGMGDAVICVVQPVPGSPGVPRVDFQLSSAPIQSAHPGDMRSHTVRLVNNDPTNSVTGTVTAISNQTARLPTVSPPQTPGVGGGVTAIATPVTGDAFPIDFADLSPDPCLSGGDPGATTVTIQRTITIPPLQSRVVTIRCRPFRMCACGSASEISVRFDGVFSDGAVALACGTTAQIVDCTVPPDFGCPDGGSMATVQAQSGSQAGLRFTGPMPTYNYDALSRLTSSSVIANAQPTSAQQPLAGVIDQGTGGTKGRIQRDHMAAGTFPVGSTVNVTFDADLSSQAPGQMLNLLSADLMLGEPSLGNSYFFVTAHSVNTGPALPAPVSSYFDVFFSVSLDGIDTSGLHHRANINTGSILRSVLNATTMRVSFSAVFPVDAALGSSIQDVWLVLDGIGNGYQGPRVDQTITAWNFNSPTPDSDTTTGSLVPSTGVGIASLVGGTTSTFASGSGVDPAAPAGDNSGVNTSTYPAQGTESGMRGIRFDVSTVGANNILVTYDQRNSNTASHWWRFEYTTDGANFTFAGLPGNGEYQMTTALMYTGVRTWDLSGIASVNNNPLFGARIVAIFAPGTSSYLQTVGATAYTPMGTARYDMVSVRSRAPVGACCHTDGSCSLDQPANCNGTPLVAISTCSPNPCTLPVACCHTDSSCTSELPANCNGILQGAFSVCSPSPCTQPGACCCGSHCSITLSSACSGANKVFAGSGVACTPFSGTTPCCRGNYNKSTSIPHNSVQDIFDFLAAYFANDPCANTNDSALPAPNGVSVQDVFDFLAYYFSNGC